MFNINYVFIVNSLGSWSSTATFIRNLANYFTTKHELELLNQFIFTEHSKFGDSLRTLTAAVHDVERNLEWTETHLSGLFKYLEHRNGANLFIASFVLIIFGSLVNLICV